MSRLEGRGKEVCLRNILCRGEKIIYYHHVACQVFFKKT